MKFEMMIFIFKIPKRVIYVYQLFKIRIDIKKIDNLENILNLLS
ncbi:hypothetical Protein psc1_02040 [Candidatus Phytoplasma solani]